MSGMLWGPCGRCDAGRSMWKTPMIVGLAFDLVDLVEIEHLCYLFSLWWLDLQGFLMQGF
jgi:hypothetical protein